MDPQVAAERLSAREAQVHAQLALIETASKRATAGGIGFDKREVTVRTSRSSG